MIITSALIIWKALMCVTSSESPVVVVLFGSMEPGFKREDILFLHMSNDSICAGEIVVFNVDGHEIPIVHRIIKLENFPKIDLLLHTRIYGLWIPRFMRFWIIVILLLSPNMFGLVWFSSKLV
ncbi:hypothetical protein UlMin_009714 [Ulmus minor]